MTKHVLILAAGFALGLTANTVLNRDQHDPPQSVGQFPNLGKGLMETPGCLGIQVFAVNGGKTQVISAWFENRKAMEAWYYSDMHQGAMKKFFPGFGGNKKPFAAFKDEKAPILVIASVTPGQKAVGAGGSNLAVAQIAIEGYTPIQGGLAIGGTFAPEKLDVPGMVRIPAGG